MPSPSTTFTTPPTQPGADSAACPASYPSDSPASQAAKPYRSQPSSQIKPQPQPQQSSPAGQGTALFAASSIAESATAADRADATDAADTTRVAAASVAPSIMLLDTAPCPCGRSAPAAKRQPRPLSFGQCCGPLLRGEQPAADAQALMRSRYSAYVLGEVAYLRHTWHPSTCPPALSLDSDVQWLGLKIERYLPINDGRAEVVFVARYRSQGRAHRLHEHSRFVREQGRWWYLDAME